MPWLGCLCTPGASVHSRYTSFINWLYYTTISSICQ
nr:MAG TPA: hypothetical protein [Caudoviricetes sp.]